MPWAQFALTVCRILSTAHEHFSSCDTRLHHPINETHEKDVQASPSPLPVIYDSCYDSTCASILARSNLFEQDCICSVRLMARYHISVWQDQNFSWTGPDRVLHSTTVACQKVCLKRALPSSSVAQCTRHVVHIVRPSSGQSMGPRGIHEACPALHNQP